MKGKLPRLAAERYRGRAYVFWTHTTEQREKLPLSREFHLIFREILLHACARYHLANPVYCLMPDHLHLLWVGLRPESDQLKASAFLRKFLGSHIRPVRWQRQAHDHVVREDARVSGRYVDTILYVLANPVRAGLVEQWQSYPYLGAILPGYPDLDRRDPSFHERFWTVVERESA